MQASLDNSTGRRGRKAVSDQDAKEISGRLWRHRRQYFTALSEFVAKIGLPPSTVSGWFAPEKPRTPDVPQLRVLAREANISLNWLLLGEPPQLLGVSSPKREIVEQFRETVIAELAAKGVADRAELEELVLGAEQLFETTVDRCKESVRARLPHYRELEVIRQDAASWRKEAEELRADAEQWRAVIEHDREMELLRLKEEGF
jgi:hypothetical protein